MRDLSNSVILKTSETFLIALVGSPNSGKTTLYNWITNSKFKTVNYPGATVETFIGNSDSKRCGEPNFYAMDTPGTYSLFPKSNDEEVTLKALYSKHPEGYVSKIILVVDGTQLERHLLMAEQLKATSFPFLIVITMSDLLKKHQIALQKDKIEEAYKVPVILFNGKTGEGLKELSDQVRTPLSDQNIENRQKRESTEILKPWSSKEMAEAQKKVHLLTEEVLKCPNGKSNEGLYFLYQNTRKIDQVLLHPVWGLLFFLCIMIGLFSSIFWLASPLMAAIDSGFSFLGEHIESLGPGSLWTHFLSHGILGSFSSVLIFVPQIFILFFGIGLLESSGYLPRAATLIDKPFSKIGLTGRSFVPLLSGYACAVPALIASRNISSFRDRLITYFVIPLMTCSARIPVYALLLSFLFIDQPAWKPGLFMAGIYFFSMLLGALVASFLNFLLKKNKLSFFMMELPLYRLPKPKLLIRQTLHKTKDYIFKAGPMIFIFAVLIWLGTTFPNYQNPDANARMQTSYLAELGKMGEPIFHPMGLDWRVGVGLLSAFMAREVFVSSLALMFNVSGSEEFQQEGLLKAMAYAQNDKGEKIFTLGSVLGLIVFFMLALQCISTFSVFVRESGSYKWPLIQLLSLNVIGYFLAVIINYFI